MTPVVGEAAAAPLRNCSSSSVGRAFGPKQRPAGQLAKVLGSQSNELSRRPCNSSWPSMGIPGIRLRSAGIGTGPVTSRYWTEQVTARSRSLETHDWRRCLRWASSLTQRCCAAAPDVASSVAGTLRTLHPSSASKLSGKIQVSGGHEVYYRVYGNTSSNRVALFVHGGPGAGCWPNHARFFNPTKWKIVLVDQRGCGSSTPKGDLKHNTTQHLVSDFEVLREKLGVDKWMLLGGSWGVTLALAYAEAHPHRVTGLILRGVCLMRTVEIDWMFRGGAAALFPQAWSSFVGILDEQEQSDPLLAYYSRLTSESDAVRSAAMALGAAPTDARDDGFGQLNDIPARWFLPTQASAWGRWEMAVGSRTGSQLQVWDGQQWSSRSQLAPSVEKALLPADKRRQPSGFSSKGQGQGAQSSNGAAPAPPAANGPCSPVDGLVNGSVNAQALLECHYSINNGFLGDDDLLSGVDRIRHIPCVMVHGRMDFVCPVRTAFDLHLAWPEAELRIVPEACHSMYDPAITHELVSAVERMENVCNWGPPATQGGKEQAKV